MTTIRRTAKYEDFGGGLFEPPVSGAGQTVPVEDMAPNEFLAFDNWAFNVRGRGIHSRNGFAYLGTKSGLNISHVCAIPGTPHLLVGGSEGGAQKIYLWNGSTFALVSSPGGTIRQMYPHDSAVYVALNGVAPIKYSSGSFSTWTTPLSDVITFGSINGRLIALEEGDTYLWVSGLNDDTHWIGDDSGRVTIPQSSDFGTLLTFARHLDGLILFTSRGVWSANSVNLSGFAINKISHEVTVLSTALHAMKEVDLGSARGVLFIGSDGKPYLANFNQVRPMCRGVLGGSRTFRDSIAVSDRMGQAIIPDGSASLLALYPGRPASGFWPMGKWSSSMISYPSAVCHQLTAAATKFIVCTEGGAVYAQDCLHPDETGFIKDDVSGANYYQIPALIRTRPENLGMMNLKHWKEARAYLNTVPGITTIGITQYFGNPHGGDATALTASPGRLVSVPIGGIREHSSLSFAFSDSATAGTQKNSHVSISRLEADFLMGPRQ